MHKKTTAIIFSIIIIIVLVIASYFIFSDNSTNTNTNTNVVNNSSENIDKNINTNKNETIPENNLDNDSDETIKPGQNIVLYNGIEIITEPGEQLLVDMPMNDENIEKYNTKFYNYDNNSFSGESMGEFEGETFDGYSIVSKVGKIAFSQKHNAIPRTFTSENTLPKELSEFKDVTSFELNNIDLDGDGKDEHLFSYSIEKTKEQTEDSKPTASSEILLFDSNYQLIETLVTLENGYWADIHEEDYKTILKLSTHVNYIDLDNNGSMEILIDIPSYEATDISIYKYEDGTLEGATTIKASVLP